MSHHDHIGGKHFKKAAKKEKGRLEAIRARVDAIVTDEVDETTRRTLAQCFLEVEGALIDCEKGRYESSIEAVEYAPTYLAAGGARALRELVRSGKLRQLLMQ